MGCSRAARQAPMWVVVRPARSEKKATCCSDGSVNMQQGGAWGRRRRRGGVIFIFGAEVLKVKVIPAICTYKFCGLCSYHQCLMRGRWTRKYSQCLFNKPNSEIQPLHCSPKRTIQISVKTFFAFFKSWSYTSPIDVLESICGIGFISCTSKEPQLCQILEYHWFYQLKVLPEKIFWVMEQEIE